MTNLQNTVRPSLISLGAPWVKAVWHRCFANGPGLLTIFILGVFSLSPVTPASAGEKLVINSGNANPYITPEGGGFYAEIAAEAFRRIDIEVEVIPVVAARALINANRGIEDGIIARIAGLEKEYPNLIRVPEKIVDFGFTAFTRDLKFKVNGWDSLKPYEIGFVSGWQIFEKNITEAKLITKVKTADHLFQMLDKDRIEVGLYERWGGAWWIRELGLDLQPLEPPVSVMPLFLYLHKQHADLVPRVTQTLRDMKKDGSYQAIYDRNLSVLIDR